MTDAVNGLAFSRLEKAFIHFSQPWWQVNVDDQGEPSKFATSTLFCTPEYTLDSNPMRANQEVFSYANLHGNAAHSTLMFYVYGENSRLLTDAIQDLSPESHEYYSTLVNFFKPYYSLLPQYDPSNPACEPERCFLTDWEHDKYAGNGSYTHFAVGLRDGPKSVAILREGVGKERGLWLAGEHTAPDIALSTIVGAYWSGEAAARRVMSVLPFASEAHENATLISLL